MAPDTIQKLIVRCDLDGDHWSALVVTDSGRVTERPGDCRHMVGMTGEQFIAECKKRGWTWKKWPQGYPEIAEEQS